jgi:hypothetical protein
LGEAQKTPSKDNDGIKLLPPPSPFSFIFFSPSFVVVVVRVANVGWVFVLHWLLIEYQIGYMYMPIGLTFSKT